MSNSFCISNPNSQIREKYIQKIIMDNHVHNVDLLNLNGETIGIKETKQIKFFLSLKPFASTKKIVVIAADALTIEAQHSLLKTLEEPPPNSLIFLSTTNINKLIPTIISRCQIIELSRLIDTGYEKEKQQTFWKSLFTQKIGERMKLTDEFSRDRSFAKNWLVEQVLFMRNELLEFYTTTNKGKKLFNSALIYLEIINELNKSYRLVKQNINLKLVFDHLFIHLPLN